MLFAIRVSFLNEVLLYSEEAHGKLSKWSAKRCMYKCVNYPLAGDEVERMQGP